MKKVLALTGMVVLFAFSASAGFAGEITGNGQLKDVNSRSICAYSGQEDLQWYTNDGDHVLLDNPVKGEPAHSQNWGQTTGGHGNTGSSAGGAAAAGCNAHDNPIK